MQLCLQLPVVVLEDVHACLQAPLVLPQQLGLGQHLFVPARRAQGGLFLQLARRGTQAAPVQTLEFLQAVILGLQVPAQPETKRGLDSRIGLDRNGALVAKTIRISSSFALLRRKKEAL